MAYDLSIPDRLVRAGLVPDYVHGWETRGNENNGGSLHFDPKGHVNHHTAGGANGAQPSLNICINGRSDLPGPLCNVFLPREESRRVIVVAAGKANHAGAGGWHGLSSNYQVTGVEVEHVGTAAEATTALRYDNMVRIAAAMAFGRFDASMVCQHREWAPTRKPDFTASGIPDVNAFRASVQDILGQMGSGPVPPPPPPPNSSTSSVLRRGSQGPAVTHVQQRLNVHSVNDRRLRVSEDGDFGPGTEKAVKVFQSDVGLGQDGVVGAQTAAALDTVPNHPAPPPPPPAARATIQQGSKGVDVKYLQARLGLSQDGDFGPKTKGAVQMFQRAHGLTADGVVGPRTWAALG